MPNLIVKRIGAVATVSVYIAAAQQTPDLDPVDAELFEEGTLLSTSRKDGDWGEDGNCGRSCTLRQRVNDAPIVVTAFVEAGAA